MQIDLRETDIFISYALCFDLLCVELMNLKTKLYS